MPGNALGAPDGDFLPTWSSHMAREADSEAWCSEVESGRIWGY